MQNYKNLIKVCNSRETDDSFRIRYQRSMHVTEDLINRMALVAELQGHQGCVNCLEWNYAGNLLASGSDDLHVIVWDPFRKKIIQNIKSGHTGNIFSVKFAMNDANILSGAAGFDIRMHDIETKAQNFFCECHQGRVKRLAVTPSEPFMFWSCAEDGIIMEYDLRAEHNCSSVCNNALINLACPPGKHVEAKCIAINALKPELLAVGANDPYVRLYDRRMIKPTTTRFLSNNHILFHPHGIFKNKLLEPGDDTILPDTVSYFVAAHLPFYKDDYYKRHRTLNVTYLAFSPDGNELLANLGGEHIYLFNIKNKRKQLVLDLDFFKPICRSSTEDGVVSQIGPKFDEGSYNFLTMSLYEHDCSPYTWSSVKEKTKYETLKLVADDNMDEEHFSDAIDAYSVALVHFPKIASLYANRASALIQRGWDGDLYQAVRDCYTALNIIPNYVNAHYRLCFAFISLHWHKESLNCLTVMKEKFPNEITKAKFKDLTKIFNRRFPTSEYNDSNSHTSTSNDGTSKSEYIHDISDQEKIWRATAYDYETRYIGHCNTTTDIKEANFFGSNGEYIVAGSDDASFYIWDKNSAKRLKIVIADGSIVNCVQPHPIACLLATSGIDPVIRLWVPNAEDCKMEEADVRYSEDAALANQKRMNADPLEVMLLNIIHLSRN